MKPAYWDQACRELSRADPVMGGIIKSAGAVHLISRGDPFVTLARSVVGQQISVKAAQTVWDRFSKAARTVEPLRVSRMRMTTLRACGLSERKAEYIRDLAAGFVQQRVNPEHWPQLPDDAIIDELKIGRAHV